MFDGFEMGIFPLVARPSLQQLQPPVERAGMRSSAIDGIITALFLLGAAVGGLGFGWLGDRLGRVRAMTLAILCYSIFTGLIFFVQTPLELGLLRFASALAWAASGRWEWPSSWRSGRSGTARSSRARSAPSTTWIRPRRDSRVSFSVTPASCDGGPHWGIARAFGFYRPSIRAGIRSLAERCRGGKLNPPGNPPDRRSSQENRARGHFGRRRADWQLGFHQLAAALGDQMAGPGRPEAKAITQVLIFSGAVVGCFVGAWMGQKMGRRRGTFSCASGPS